MTERRTDVDVVRCAALVAMYVAHVAPSRGPAGVLELSEYVAMPLFAALVGVGAQLGAWTLPTRGELGWWRSMLVRAAVLVGLGLLLDQAGAQVVVVLVHLGVLVLVADPLARCATRLVASVTLAAGVVTPWLVHRAATHGLLADGWFEHAQVFAWVGGPYRLATMTCFAGVGILLARWWLRGREERARLLPAAAGGGALALAATMLAAEQAGHVDLVPYSGSHAETLLDVLLVVGVVGVALAAARLAAGSVVVKVLAAAGSMALSLYCLQVLWLALDARVLHPGRNDDAWANLVVLVVGSLVVATTWRRVVRREPWRRGPLEGPVRALSGRFSTGGR